MTDKKMYQLLERFGNEHLLSKDVKVSIYSSGKSFKAVGDMGGNYNDIVLLDSLIQGAESFLMWARRKKVKL